VVRSRCKYQGEVCKVVIDTGSSNNLVSTEMVQKLNLAHFHNLTLYTISMLRKGHNLVNKLCYVSFIIGPYEDKILCDVVSVDT
jgi:hypothetical protein